MRCDNDIHLPAMNKEYNTLKNNTLVVETFKNEFQCSDIIFNNNFMCFYTSFDPFWCWFVHLVEKIW